jgi:catechol 2,3-dioxygenase-like lactoylglutathione lyase family enzyme
MDWKLEVVSVSVSDVDRARDFYADKVGFHLDLDRWVTDKQRVVQLTPLNSGCSVHLTTDDMPPGSMRGLVLVVSDVDAAQAALAERGVPVSGVMHFENGEQVPGRGDDWNSFAFFSDPDGNSWTVQERPAAR